MPGASYSAGVIKVWIWRAACDPHAHHAPRRAERYDKSPKTVTVGGKINRKPPKYRGIREVDTA